MVQNATLEKGSSSPVRNRWIIIATIAVCIGGTTTDFSGVTQYHPLSPTCASKRFSRQNGHGIGALGAKRGNSAFSASSQASRVEQLLVKEGDRPQLDRRLRF